MKCGNIRMERRAMEPTRSCTRSIAAMCTQNIYTRQA
jgi:hypothetical protein